MKFDKQLAKLEQRAKRAFRCAWCRYVLRDIAPKEQKQYNADPASHGSSSCLYCGATFTFNLAGLDEYEREATILCYKHEWGATYRDERFYAASTWVVHSRVVKLWKAGELTEEKVKERKKRIQARREAKNKDRFTQEQAELKERAYSFLQKMHEKEEKEFAPHGFPLAAELEAIEKPSSIDFVPGTYKRMMPDESIAHKMLYRVFLMEACERVLWNKTLPQTEAVKDELNAVIQRCEAEREEKEREAEEEKARREAERERERLERLAATQPVIPQSPPAKPSPVWIDNGTIGSQQRMGQYRSSYPGQDDD